MGDESDEVPLRDHFEARLTDLEKLVASNLKAHEREHELMEGLNVTFFIAVVGCITAAVDMLLRIFGK